MSFRTLEVELENGVVHASGTETLPAKAHALLTILTPATPAAAAPTTPRSLGDACRELPSGKPERSLADLLAEFRGIGNGAHTDLSTNKRHMDDFGK